MYPFTRIPSQECAQLVPNINGKLLNANLYKSTQSNPLSSIIKQTVWYENIMA